jgi:hypothetical protein
MSANNSSRAAELAAAQVESIVAAAQAAADQIRQDARLELAGLRPQAEREAEAIRAEAARELETVQRQALRLHEDARREARALLAEAKAEADQVREQTRRAVEGRVANAEQAASEVLEEARVLSSGLRQLGELLSEHGERILREVHAAHRRMQAELRVGRPSSDRPTDAPAPGAGQGAPARSNPERTSRFSREAPSSAPAEGPSSRDDLDVPAWLGGSP